MARVIERLQVEADLQGGIILDTWADERSVDRKLTDIKSYAYTFLVQSFLPPQRGSSGTPRSNSPAQGRVSEDEGVDMREVDALLSEMALMLGRWSLYVRFVSDKCLPQEENDEIEQTNDETAITNFLQKSTLMKNITDRVIHPFNTMTTFFFRRSVEKAFQLDEQPQDLMLNPHKPLHSNPPYVSSAVDDIMYIVNKVLQQSLATSQETVVNSVIPTLSRVMGADFIGMIQRKMRDESYPKAAIAGALPPEHIIVAFIVLINDLDVAADYINRIIETQTQPQQPSSPSPIATLFPFPTQSLAVERHLNSFTTSFASSTTTLLSEANIVLFNQVLKPRLRPILMDSFRDIDYSLTAEELSSHSMEDSTITGQHDDSSFGEDPDLVRRRFQHGWDALTRPIGRLMTDKTFHRLLSTAVNYLANMLETRIWGYYGRVNELGAVRLERDVNAIVDVVGKGLTSLPSATGGSGARYGFKAEFRRCLGILMICNLEEDEWEEFLKEAVPAAAAGDSTGSGLGDGNGNAGDGGIITGAGGGGGNYGLTREEMERARGIVRDYE